MISVIFFCDISIAFDRQVQDERKSVGTPFLVFTNQGDQSVEYYQMNFDSSVIAPPLNMDLPLKKFNKVGEDQLQPGETFQVDSYVVAEKMLAVIKRLTWRTHDGVPGLDDLRDGLDPVALEDQPTDLSVEKKQALEQARVDFRILLSKLAEERRFAKDPDEYQTYLKRYDPTGRFSNQAVKRGRFNPYLFPTGFVEVSSRSGKMGNPNVKYFIRLEDAFGPKVQLDLNMARLKILHGLTVYLFHKMSTKQNPPQLLKAKKAVQQICEINRCILEGDRPVGKFVVDTLLIFLAGHDESFSSAKLDRINFRKQICVLWRLRQVCPGLKDLSAADEWVKKTKNLDCDNMESILGG